MSLDTFHPPARCFGEPFLIVHVMSRTVDGIVAYVLLVVGPVGSLYFLFFFLIFLAICIVDILTWSLYCFVADAKYN